MAGLVTTKNSNWQKDNLENLLDILIDHRGITPTKLSGDWSASGIPALSAKNIKTGKIVNEQDIRFVSQKLYEKWMPEKLEDGDILLTSEAPLGELYFLKEKKDYVLSQRLFALRTNRKKLNSRYLYYYLQGSIGRQELLRRLSGTAAEGIRQAELRKINVEFPEDILEQEKIASVISAFDDKIEVNNKIAKTLEELAQAIFKEWFVNFRFPGYEKVEFVDSERGKIPKVWRVGKIKELGRVVTGKTPSTEDKKNFGSEYPFITIPDMTNTFITKTERFLSKISAEKMKNLLLPAASICVSCIATVGLVGITTEKSFTNQQINSLIPNKETYTYYLYLYFKNKKKELELFGSGGTATLIINKAKFESLELVIPNQEIMKQFHDLVSPMYEKIMMVIKENQKLVALRDLLLPKLMRGEVRV